MADSSSRNNSLRIPRLRGSANSSRNPSIRRSSAFTEETRLPSGAFPSLRSTDSRYSLNEQFAATRQEYEFGDDDASSIYERMTVASDAGEANGEKSLGFDDFVIPEEDFGSLEDDDPSDAPRLNHYELLCLPRDAGLSQNQIRQAYYRLLLLLYPDSYPDYLQPIARRHFYRVQEAFETLIDPYRRAAYDEALSSEGEQHPEIPEAYEDTYEQTLSACVSNALSSEPEMRLGGARPLTFGNETPAWTTKPALGFTLGHTVQIGIPALEKFLQRSIGQASCATAGQVGEAEASSRLKLGTPTLSVTGALHGLFEGSFPGPKVLLGGRSAARTSSGHPAGLSPDKLSRRSSGEATRESDRAQAVQDAQRQHPQGDIVPAAIPGGILNVRLTQPITLPGSTEPTFVDVVVENPALGGRCPVPRVSLGVQHKLPHGTVFVRGDSGQWLCSSDRTRTLSELPAGTSRSLWSGVLPFTSAPSAEFGFTTEATRAIEPLARTRGLQSPTGQTAPPISSGTWTASATTTGTATAGYLRYTRHFAPRHAQRSVHKRASRVEVELCAGTWQGSYLALRNLLPVGRLSAAGLELGVSQHSLHLSVHWARLNQRISLPVLLCPRIFSSPSLIFWAGVLPMAGLAAVDLLRQYWRGSRSRRPGPPAQSPTSQASVVRSRAEADRLVTLLSGPVDARQKRLAASGDLVILNAKFGIRDDAGSWAAEEVADVTVALAALVGCDGRLVIPRGVCKGHLLGFWDPAPDREKVLFVRYTWRGKEDVAEVQGEEQLCLPAVVEAVAS
ncbi:hypothetical protein HJFPF1_01309 [Paramyrothecium foliicola]|nr:hypothetical protein HJFPF1_01309 [Paramyrothecium foliicola]